MFQLREKLINQVNGSDTMAVKYHYDGLVSMLLKINDKCGSL